MIKVITYGTYDIFHQGHYNLLKRAKELGDYLIVGVTSESFDKNRGKLNVRDPLLKRIENVKKTGFADEIIVEEYVGQKIDDIKRYHIDIFTVGSDWRGYFDYLKEYCQVCYLERTVGISSTYIRNKDTVNLGIVGAENIVSRVCQEARYVSGFNVMGIFDETERIDFANDIALQYNLQLYTSCDEMFSVVDAVYVCSPPNTHYSYIKKALTAGKHVICEFPFCFYRKEAEELFRIADKHDLILMHGLKTAYVPAFQRLIALVKSGMIGRLVSVDASFTQVLGAQLPMQIRMASGGSMNAIAEYPLLAIIKLLGKEYKNMMFFSNKCELYDIDGYTKFYLQYEKAIASGTVAINAKSEGSLVVTGTKGYFYVPAPWWKTEYFEARFEDVNKNMKYFYKFQGEGLRYEFSELVRCIITGERNMYLSKEETLTIVELIEKYNSKENVRFF